MSEAIEIGDTVKAWPRGGGMEDGTYVVRNISTVTNYHLESAIISGIFMDTVYCELVKKACDHRDPRGRRWGVIIHADLPIHCPKCGDIIVSGPTP